MAELAGRWLKKAESDLLVAKHVLADLWPKQIDISCYHSQQGGEKALKAFLVAHDIDPPKTHDLLGLCQKCAEIEQDFQRFLNDCDELTIYGVITRYPNKIEITEQDAANALEKASRIYHHVLTKINPTNSDQAQ
jgi:HEPN domain-containing protein